MSRSPRRALRRTRAAWRRYVSPRVTTAKRGAFGMGRVVGVCANGGLTVEGWCWPEDYGRAPPVWLEVSAPKAWSPAWEGQPVAFWSWRETSADGTTTWRRHVADAWRPPTARERVRLLGILEDLEKP